jgi:glycosyltransferase involved in cell wall biosynthesis
MIANYDQLQEESVMPKVSVIVPAYNAARTLAGCLGCLVGQTLGDIEIIVVNDCSTDNTLSIMMDCEAQFPDKVMVVNLSENLGAGGARNVGLEYAHGEYIGFMDSDDLVVPDMYKKMYEKAMEDDYDMVDCGYFNEATDSALVHTSDDLTGILDDHKRSELIASGGYLWSRIFKKSLLQELGIQFRTHCILEDCETLMLLFARAKSIGNVKEILYCYKCYDTSISKCVTAASYHASMTAAIEAVYNTLSPLPNYDGIKEAVEYSIVNFCALCANVCLTTGANDPYNVTRARLMKLSGYLHSMVTIPLERNHYIQNKISKKDLQTVKDLLETF